MSFLEINGSASLTIISILHSINGIPNKMKITITECYLSILFIISNNNI